MVNAVEVQMYDFLPYFEMRRRFAAVGAAMQLDLGSTMLCSLDCPNVGNGLKPGLLPRQDVGVGDGEARTLLGCAANQRGEVA